ncbi:MAG TPA: MtrB/PioB family outer membrane beta-barrel protein, partial [Telluria sp.]
NFTDVGKERGWNGLDFGFDYTFSNTRSDIVVTATPSPFQQTAPLPQLQAKMRSYSLWGSFQLGDQSSIRLTAEASDLSTSDWALDGVVPDTLANVLLLGESAANYDLWLVYASWNYRV